VKSCAQTTDVLARQRLLLLAALASTCLIMLASTVRGDEATPKPTGAVSLYDNSPDKAALEARLKQAYDTYQKQQAAKQANAQNGQKQGGQQQKPENDPEYKEMMQANLTMIQTMMKEGDAKFDDKSYRDAATFYASVAMANVPKSEQLVQKARARFLEMEDMAAEHLKAADDAILTREYLKAVEELGIVVKEFPFSKVYSEAYRTLVSLKSRPDIAGLVSLTEAEGLEANGNISGAVKAYKEIANNPRFENSLAWVKATKKLEALNNNAEVKAALKGEMNAKAEKEAPGLLSTAHNFALNNDFAKAKEKYALIVEKFPGTKFAEQAQSEMDKIK